MATKNWEKPGYQSLDQEYWNDYKHVKEHLNKIAQEFQRPRTIITNWNPPTKPVKSDTVNHPLHYAMGKFEVIDVIEDWGLDKDYPLACVIKYIARAKHKGNELEDLKKARWYLDRAIQKREKEKSSTTDSCGLTGTWQAIFPSSIPPESVSINDMIQSKKETTN